MPDECVPNVEDSSVIVVVFELHPYENPCERGMV